MTHRSAQATEPARSWCSSGARGLFVPSLVALSLVAIACHPAYRPPTLNEPHATLKTRIIYHQASGPQLDQRVLVNDASVPVPVPPELFGEIARAILARPIPTRMRISAMFFHTMMRMQATTETYPCGTPTTPRSCTRTVWRSVPTRIPDGICDREIAFAPQLDGVYLTQFDYFGPDQCSLVCFRELAQPDGSFRNAPCEVAAIAPPPS